MNEAPASNRILLIDGLRGFALFGVLIANTLAFAHKEKLLPNLAALSVNPGLRSFVYFFVEGSFYPLFTFLFGYGLAMQLSKANDLAYLRRRLLLLLALGILHGTFFFSGDILHAYALVGLFSLPFYPKLIASKKKRWLFALLLVFSVLIFWGTFALEASLDASSYEATDYSLSSYLSITTARISELMIALITLPIFAAQLLLFLGLGMLCHHYQLLREAMQHKKFWRKLFLSCTFLSLSLLSLFYFSPDGMKGSLMQSLEFSLLSPALGFAYLSGIVLLYPFAPAVFKPLTAVGKLSLSNYLMQSLLMTTLFYGYGLGWYDKLSLGSSLWVALILFVLQILLSNLWLKYFRYGPAEWLWRSLSLREPIALKR